MYYDVVYNIINPTIVRTMGLFRQLLDGMPGVEETMVGMFLIYIVFRFVLGPIFRVESHRFGLAASDKIHKVDKGKGKGKDHKEK